MADLIWTAQPKQAEFLLATEYVVGFGGARGGGKTDAMLIKAIMECVNHPGLNALLIRRDFARLMEVGAAIPRSLNLLSNYSDARWDASNHRWIFSNGSVFQFGHLSDTKAIEKYLGTQADLMLLDQAEELKYDEYLRLRGSNRATIDGFPPQMRLTFNPGGIGQGWIKSEFVDAAPWGSSYLLEQGGTTVAHRFIPAKVWDNQELLRRDPEYVNRLRSLGGNLARAWLDGDWDQFEGQYFPEFRRDIHVCKPFKIPASWPRWHSTDWGLAAPSCTLWLTRDPKSGRVYVYRERYESGKTIEQQALKILLWSGDEHYKNRLLDPSCWSREANGVNKAQQYANAGIPMARANNDRIAGWTLLRRLLQWSTNFEDVDAPTFPPTLQIFENCSNLIRTLPNLIHDQKHPEDCDTDSEDHAPDALRYGVMGMELQGDGLTSELPEFFRLGVQR